jgi:hypothetical protein
MKWINEEIFRVPMGISGTLHWKHRGITIDIPG